MIRVVAHVTALPGHAAPLRAVLLALLAPTRAEPGCLFYDLHAGDTPDVFTFIEAWATEADLDRHLQSAHIQQALVDIAPHVANAPDIRRYRVISD
jgi:quinol monooxygenase YgiN